ncbi:hypothetical protein CFC21_026056 [Triticum aestivum]|uniref:Knottin scorpion toxin-like domain-containing protein n=2 Tax=Triticum aestivum TaxID=4565 RepID=A0A9R1JBX2_WHEAT|nr:hypothetical protein CFC21_026056 [Triticum aestivum]
MALIRINSSVHFLMALMMISSTLLSSEASGRNIGMEANIGVEGRREPYTPCSDPSFCNDICKRDGKGGGTCSGGACYCNRDL